MEPIKYSSIGQFRNLVKDVQFAYKEALPKLKMTGTVKVHGTNASVIIDSYGDQYPQSKNNILTVEEDNLGFALWHKDNESEFAYFAEYIDTYFDLPQDSTIIIYGEWAGKGIQKGVAVSEVDKFFYIFGVKVVFADGSKKWMKDYPLLYNDSNIFDARNIWQKEIEIDFSMPSASQNALVEITEAVEKECPVGLALGVSGVGEGVVWEHINDEGERLSCKVKGEKHSSSKVKKLAAVDTEKLESIEAFVSYAVTDNRLQQGFQEVCNNEADRKLLGAFIKWVSADVHKEESDTLAESGLTMKDVGGTLSKRAKNWFFAQEAL